MNWSTCVPAEAGMLDVAAIRGRTNGWVRPSLEACLNNGPYEGKLDLR
jgi:hypothetical protein